MIAVFVHTLHFSQCDRKSHTGEPGLKVHKRDGFRGHAKSVKVILLEKTFSFAGFTKWWRIRPNTSRLNSSIAFE